MAQPRRHQNRNRQGNTTYTAMVIYMAYLSWALMAMVLTASARPSSTSQPLQVQKNYATWDENISRSSQEEGLGGSRSRSPQLLIKSFGISDNRFMRNGRPISLRAGEIHYSRVHPGLWEDRLRRIRAMGLNTVQVYCPWNFHESEGTTDTGILDDIDLTSTTSLGTTTHAVAAGTGTHELLRRDWGGNFDFGHGDPWKNVSKFINLCKAHGLMVVLRAGPYVCGEWEFGGLPAWLLKDGPIALRTDAQPYLGLAERWLRKLLGELQSELWPNGGPIIAVQVENEFGSYGDVSKSASDLRYMQRLISLTRELVGPDVLLTTVDGGSAEFMLRGSLPGGAVLTLGDGCNDPNATAAAQASFNPKGQSPFFCGEFYTGWLTHWGEDNANTSSRSTATGLDAVLGHGGTGAGSASLYMAHGGTNFEFWSGANGQGGRDYAPDVTSYDYDAPISEGGGHGFGVDGIDKFLALSTVLYKHAAAESEPLPPPEPPAPRMTAFGAVKLSQTARLLDPANLEALATFSVSNASEPVTMEALPNCARGFVLYEASIPIASPSSSRTFSVNNVTDDGSHRQHILSLPGMQDMALVFARGVFVGTTNRTHPTDVSIPAPEAGYAESEITLQVLVENMGRINFKRGMELEQKGIIGGASGVLLDGRPATPTESGWHIRCLALESAALDKLRWQDQSGLRGKRARGTGFIVDEIAGPAFFRGNLDVSHADAGSGSYLEVGIGGTKGVAWVNELNLGRYWLEKKPQRTLFVPNPVLREGRNKVVVLELFPPPRGEVRKTMQQRALLYLHDSIRAVSFDDAEGVYGGGPAVTFRDRPTWGRGIGM